MNRIHSHLAEVDLIGQLADLKEDHYKNILVLSALIDLLIEKGIVTREELTCKALELDAEVGI
ncbi:MAG: hypothetical protein K0R75_1016 [Paenibacillaceae bacterium]|nr:hypothetical protein [Paenibacillaceae bacterium]